MPATPMLPTIEPDPPTKRCWFSNYGCVVRGEAQWEVWVGGTLVGVFEPGDKARRNVILVGLLEDPKTRKGRVARAFGISDETVRLVRRRYETEGVRGLIPRTAPGPRHKVTAALRRNLWKMFDKGASVADAVDAVGRAEDISEVTLRRERARWKKNRAPSSASDTQDGSSPVDDSAESEAEAPELSDEVAAGPVVNGRTVQHLGTWLMIALLNEVGLYTSATKVAGGRVAAASVRVVLDSVVAALALGQRCVEGLRRLATPSAPVLLRAGHAPSASWARRVLGKLAMNTGGVRLQLAMAGRYLKAASAATNGEPVVFYVDNHMRPYTGKHTTRKGWRMQERRVLPGTSDYYVHDVDGRPILRKVMPDNASMTSVLTSIAQLLRQALPEDRILLVFDRAGAFPVQLAELREKGFEFATYERRPYALLTETEFDEKMNRKGETLLLHESSRKNLGRGRGRVRRIAVRNSEGRQLNVLAISEQPVAWLVDVMLGRWIQENAFKHGVERWGINQLDSRTVEHYEPRTVIPNPARRRLDRALRVARVSEGDALRELGRLDDDHPANASSRRQRRPGSDRRSWKRSGHRYQSTRLSRRPSWPASSSTTQPSTSMSSTHSASPVRTRSPNSPRFSARTCKILAKPNVSYRTSSLLPAMSASTARPSPSRCCPQRPAPRPGPSTTSSA